MNGADPGPTLHPLVSDGALAVKVDAALLPLVERWLPRLPASATPRALARAAIDIRAQRGEPRRETSTPSSTPLLTLDGVAGRFDERDGMFMLEGAHAGYGIIDLAALRATLTVRAEVGAASHDVYSMLTISAALLLGRLGRALVHAAAAVAPDDGRAWLLVGDSRAGKSTTTANLVRAGWRFLADDNVVVSTEAETDCIVVDGWPREFHLDDGWERGAPTGVRRATAPDAFAHAWLRSAPLGGILLPRVEAASPTQLAEVAPSLVLAGLIRQSPWLIADRAAAPGALSLLGRAAHCPGGELRLGLDTFGDPDRLDACFRAWRGGATRLEPPVSASSV